VASKPPPNQELQQTRPAVQTDGVSGTRPYACVLRARILRGAVAAGASEAGLAAELQLR